MAQKLVLHGKQALVVGGSGGIGRAVSRRLAEAGAEVCVHGGSSEERLERTLGEIRSAGGQAEGFLCQAERAEELVGEIERRLPFAVVVVAFGPYLRAPLAETPVRDWVRLCELNLALPGAIVSVCAPAMQAAGFGRFVLFGGPRTDGIEAYTTIAAYAAAKTGVATLVRSAARQLNRFGITVNGVCPGYVATEYYSEVELERIAARMPDGEPVTVEEVAAVVMQLVGPGSKALNGALIRIDKGL